MNYSTKAQGTMEYLVIIALVVIISLFVVTIALNQSDNVEKINQSGNKVENIVGKGGISVVDSLTSSSGNAIFSLKNNSGNTLIIKTITPLDQLGNEGTPTNINEELLPGYTSDFILENISIYCPCSGNQNVICTIKIDFESSSGLTQSVQLTVTNPCTENINYFTLNYSAQSGGRIIGNSIQKVLPGKNGSAVTAEAQEGYIFTQWNDGSTNPTRTENNVNENKNITAEFQEDVECNINSDCENGRICENKTCVNIEDIYFIFKIRTTSSPQTFGVYIENANEFDINWGDGSENNYYSENYTNTITHSYSVAGDYNILIRGNATRISFGGESQTTPQLLINILTPISNGITGINSSRHMFNGTTNISSFTAEDFFDETSKNITNMSWMFANSKFNQPITNWDTSKVENMSYLFTGSIFNQEINYWNTSNVINMYRMFMGSIFNKSLNSWDVSKVSDMGGMFSGSNFNETIKDWNTANLENLSGTFHGSPFDQNINNWKTPKLKNMSSTFANTSFNQNISEWDTSQVTNMNQTFFNNPSFNQNISTWNTSSVENMVQMFGDTTSFNQDLSLWNVNSVTWCSAFSEGATSWVLSKPNFTSCSP